MGLPTSREHKAPQLQPMEGAERQRKNRSESAESSNRQDCETVATDIT